MNETNINPIKKFREEHSIPQVKLAQLAGVGRQVILRLEAGTFNYVPESVLHAIEIVSPLTADSIEADYKNWIKQELIRFARPYFDKPHILSLIPSVGEVGARSFMEWRQRVNLSLSGFCKLLKVQDVIISNYQNGKTQNMPELLKYHLELAGWSHEQIEELAELPVHV